MATAHGIWQTAHNKKRSPCCGWRVVIVSGNANNSGQAGGFIVNANNDSANLNPNIGAQVSLLQQNGSTGMETLPLGKTHSRAPSVLVGASRRLRGEISRREL